MEIKGKDIFIKVGDSRRGCVDSYKYLLESSINEAIENIFIRTRQYAKRQKKWFNVNNYDISFDLHQISKNDIVDKLIQIN